MRTYMLDTDICSYIMRKEAAVHRRLLEELRAGSKIVISATTYSELLFGAKMPKTPKRWLDALDTFLANCVDGVLPVNAAVVERAAEIQYELRKKGEPIGINDVTIAAHAITENCICVTNNTREYGRVPGLVLENWAQ